MENYAEFKTLEGFNASLGFEPIGTNIPLKDFFKNEQCECGYAPHEKVNKRILKLMKKNRRSYGQDISQIEDNIQKEKACPSNCLNPFIHSCDPHRSHRSHCSHWSHGALFS